MAIKHILYDFNSLKCIKVCFMAQDRMYLGECFMCS